MVLSGAEVESLPVPDSWANMIPKKKDQITRKNESLDQDLMKEQIDGLKQQLGENREHMENMQLTINHQEKKIKEYEEDITDGEKLYAEICRMIGIDEFTKMSKFMKIVSFLADFAEEDYSDHKKNELVS